MLARGRPKKMRPKIILGLLHLPFSGEEIVAEYLEMRYHFTRISLEDLWNKELLKQDLKKEERKNLSHLFGPEYAIKEALKIIEEEGRPGVILTHFSQGEEVALFLKLKQKTNRTIFLTTDLERRWQFYQHEGENSSLLTKLEFNQKDQELLEKKDQWGKSFKEYFQKANFRMNTHGELGRIYEETERILKILQKKDIEDNQIIETRKKIYLKEKE